MDTSIATETAILKAAASELGSFTIRVENLSWLDSWKDDPTAPAAGAWWNGVLYIDTRNGGPDLPTALGLLATVVAQAAVERVDDFLTSQQLGAADE